MKTMKKPWVESLDLARRIRAAGVHVYIEEDDFKGTNPLSEGLHINLYGGLTESAAFNFYGGTVFIIYLTIAINLPRFAISAFDLELPWTSEIRWLEDPREIGGGSNVYKFGGRNLPEFERNRVLNHFADVARILPRGSSLKGCLLGIGTSPIPDCFSHGAIIPGFLIVFDQYGRRYRSSVSLWSDRKQDLAPGTCSKVTRKRLFECPDKDFDRREGRKITSRSWAKSGAKPCR